MRLLFLTAVLFNLIFFGCEAPQKYREVQIGMTSNDVIRLLGNPDKKVSTVKIAPTVEYFGPKPSSEYLNLSDGTLVEVWYYEYFREEFSYIFNVEQDPPLVIDIGYFHPDINY